MPEVTSRKKFECPACGAAAEWNPSRQALVCPFCGVTSPAQMRVASDGQEVIEEHDLMTALRNVPADQRGWQTERISVKCQSCQAISVFDPARVGQRCDFCGSAALVPYEEIKPAFRPESLLPMKLGENQVRDLVRHWCASRWFAPNRLKQHALIDTVKGIYIPYWTFDAQAHADWSAESGYYYYETETYRDSQGNLQTRRVQKTRWVPSSGAVDHRFDDELVPATRGLQEDLLRGVEPFPTKDLQAYSPAYLSGWVVERYQIDLAAAAQRSRDQMEAQMCSLCAAAVPGDTQRHLRVSSRYAQQTFKHILVPVWLLTYNFGARAFQVLINGCTGAIKGHYPKSWVKISLAAVTVLLLIGLVILLSQR
jgi:hypothetical protein